MKIAEITDGLRSLINQYSEVETPHTDYFLYHLFGTEAAYLIKQKEEKNHKLSDFTLKYYPLQLELSNTHDFDCYPSCDVLKTKYPVPQPITARNRDIMKVYTFDHREIPYIRAQDFQYLQYDPIRKGKLHYSIIRGYIVIWNGDTTHIVPKAILVAGRFQDPTQWSEIPSCDSNGQVGSDACYDLLNDEFPIETDLVNAAYRRCLELLNISIQIPTDRINEQSH